MLGFDDLALHVATFFRELSRGKRRKPVSAIEVRLFKNRGVHFVWLLVKVACEQDLLARAEQRVEMKSVLMTPVVGPTCVASHIRALFLFVVALSGEAQG